MAQLADSDVVIVEAVRSPLGRRNGGLATVHPAELLAHVQRAAVERSGIDPALVGQVVGGCVSQVGEQTFNIARTAWLSAGLPLTVAATTVDSQCGSSQQATNLAATLVKAGVVDVALSCGVESMSRVPLGAAVRGEYGRPTPKSYVERYELTSQFEGAERIAEKWGVTRDDCDRFGLLSQERAQHAWAEGRFEREVVAIDAPTLAEDGTATGTTRRIERDEGLRETSLDKLAALKPVARENGVHTAGTSSQITDGAAAVLLTTAARARELGLRPRARVVDQCLVGVDPVLMLTGPIDATQHILDRNRLQMSDLDLVEINEAFASVVLAWERELRADRERVNPNGGAIALGHPVGATGARLITTALHELERTDATLALVTMCCGGGLGSGTLLERVQTMPALDGLLEGEEIVAMLSVRYSPGAPTSLEAAPKPGVHRPSVVQRHAYALWSRHSTGVGFPVAGPEMILGTTQERLLVWSPTFVRSRPGRFAGAIPLSRIQRAGVHRRLFASVLTLLFEKGTIVGVETMRSSRLRRFASTIPSYTEYKPR